MINIGVRKYDEDIGRFTSVDPLWSKYIGWTPYHYCGNDPINASDGNGMWFAYANNGEKKIYEHYLLEICHSDEGKKIVDFLADTDGKGLKQNVNLHFGKVEERDGLAGKAQMHADLETDQDGGGISNKWVYHGTDITIDKEGLKSYSKENGKNVDDMMLKAVIHELIHTYRQATKTEEQKKIENSPKLFQQDEKSVQKETQKIYNSTKNER
jgi:hypothetical protein